MGKRLIACISEDPNLELAEAIEHAGHPCCGNDAGALAGVESVGVEVADQLIEAAASQAVIDFSTPEGAQKAIDFCVDAKIPLVMATTGLEEAQISSLKSAAESIPVVWAPSMSLAVNLMMKVTQFVGGALKGLDNVDVEIIERHHRFKVDAPSGTALKFGELVAESMDLKKHVHGREGVVGQRTDNEIGYHAVRAGDDPGQHTILFGMQGEKIELHVAASNRDCYALGALTAAKFAIGKPPGLYDMFDVLGLNDGQV